MNAVETAATSRWTARLLVAVIAMSLAAAGGAVAAHLVPDDLAVADELGTTASHESPDLDPVARSSAAIVERLAAELPVPEPAPADPYAPTLEVRHGVLEIPAIGLAQPFFEGVTLTAINRGPSHWPGTAMPGELGNVVLAGHRTTYTRPFWDLDRLQPGDALVFTMDDGARHVYELVRLEIVDPDALHIVDQTYGYRATLFGCHPKGSARQRIVGHFTLVSSSSA